MRNISSNEIVTVERESISKNKWHKPQLQKINGIDKLTKSGGSKTGEKVGQTGNKIREVGVF